MKKLIFLFIIGLCAFPVCAQWRTLSGWTYWSGRAGWNRLGKSAASSPRVAGNVEEGVTRALVKIQPPMATHIQITNLPGEPLVKLGTPLPVINGVPGNPFPVLQARIMHGEENDKHLFRRNGNGFFPSVYVPEALNTQEKAGFRGLKLYNLRDVQHILEHGLEYNKVAEKMGCKIYFADGVYHAAGHMTDGSRYLEIPTLVRFQLLPNEINIHASISLFGDLNYYYWWRNIPPRYIQDVMVFLEVGGVPGWYKATLEKGELVLTPAPGRVFKSSELITHDFDIPAANIQDM